MNIKEQINALEKQLIMCELQGRTTKAMLVRSTLRGMKIAESVRKQQPRVEANCARCGEKFLVARIHLPETK